MQKQTEIMPLATLVLLATALLWTGRCGGSTAVPSATLQCQQHQGAIIRGPQADQRLALVFTGHEFAEGAETILAALARHRGSASFFLTGTFLTHPDFAPLIQRMRAEGHYLGPHSDGHLLYCEWDAARTTRVTRKEFTADLLANVDKLMTHGITPTTGARYFMPPFEHYNAEIASWSTALGWTLVNFTPGTRSNADYTGEADATFVSSDTILESILTRQRKDPQGLNGFLLLMHLGSGPGRSDKFHLRLGELLDRLAGQGYQFVRVDELLDGCPHAAGAAEVFVRASQVTYHVNDVKMAMAFSEAPLPPDFRVVRGDDPERVVLRGETTSLTHAIWGRFPHHAELDFSALRTPGVYLLKVGGADSLPVRIGHETGAELVEPLLEFMRQQRCGFNPWLDAYCHQADGRTAYGPLTNGSPLDARGGWHDAGDLLKYLLTSGNATAQMLLAYEVGRKAHNAGQLPRTASPFPALDRVDALGLPGTNGVPDLLDEARWGLEWMLKLHPAPDQLYHQVADDRDHAGWRLPQDDPVDYGWGKGGARVVYFADGQPQGLRQYQSASSGVANLAGRYAAAMALAWQIWRDDPAQREFAERCLKAGREVYELGRVREGVQQGNSYQAPYRYEETTWADDMEWGAAELFRATGERRYLDEAQRYALLAADEGWMGREQAGHYQFYPFMNLGHFRLYDLVDVSRQETLAGYYRDGVGRCVRVGESNPYRVGAPFIWCSNNLLVALATQCLLYERMTGDSTHRAFATKQRDWLLGRNPWGTTMFTGIGTDSPADVHLMTTRLTQRPVRGGLVDGPVAERIFRSLKGVSLTLPDPLEPFQGPAVYHDDWQDYASNEPTMDGTASAILMFALWGAAER